MNNNSIQRGARGDLGGKEQLGAKIKALAFAKTEAELFLDTHPASGAALSYYHEIVDELEKLKEEYTDEYGPLTADGSSRESWNWIDGPWPWQRSDDKNTKGDM